MRKHVLSLIGSEHRLNGFYSKFAELIALFCGKSGTFILSCLIIIIWLISGPFFNYSDTWQLVINTGTTIITFLMMFLLQNTQNRDTIAIQEKLDALLLEVALLTARRKDIE